MIKNFLKSSVISIAITLLLCSCSDKDKIMPPTIEQSPEELFVAAKKNMYLDHKDAARSFEKIENYYPESPYVERGLILKSYMYYINQKYDDAEITIENFLSNYPANPDTDYMRYLLAMTFYMQVSDVERDQKNTHIAREKIRELLDKHPHSPYAKEADKLMYYLKSVLASKEMEIGRFYQKNNNPSAALGRFHFVIDNYEGSEVFPEALYRLGTIYCSLGMVDPSNRILARLRSDYGQSKWLNYAERDGKNCKKCRKESDFVEKKM